MMALAFTENNAHGLEKLPPTMQKLLTLNCCVSYATLPNIILALLARPALFNAHTKSSTHEDICTQTVRHLLCVREFLLCPTG